ncbi:MAG: lipid A biosynthesis (KDO)2-(lauroyl)-lipid IVA acyltransferase [Dysgonamonadaceae bacterium]|jgi:predicted LPLAT superfamily acyltransferase|nr:lipid A biosynthesis (KDO)2-(lauroyl)-lipid IVA acyltransferase [Dysgonamonadaceae bacterium]
MAENLKWKGNTGGGTLGQRGLIFFFRWWNLRLGYAIMAVVVLFYMLCAWKSYLAIYHYFREQLGFSVWKSFCKTYRNHFLFGQVILDRFAVFAGRKNDFEIEIVGYEYYERLADGEKGFVVVGSHTGNFEIAGYLLNGEKKRINALVFGGETQIVQQNRTKILNGNNINLVPVSPDMSHLFIANAALANGEIVSMPADRVFGSSKSIECEFIRGKADFPVGAFALAVNAEVEVLAVFCMKESAKKYKIYAQPLSCYRDGIDPQSLENKKEKIENLVFSYVEELEKMVKQYPEHWFNYYKFWK